MSPLNTYFICSPDSHVGKTVVCTGLLAHFPQASAVKITTDWQNSAVDTPLITPLIFLPIIPLALK